MKIKLSELNPDTHVDCNGEVMTAEKTLEKAKTGEVVEVYLITDEYRQSILHQAYEQYHKGICTDTLTATNNGEKVIVDICNFCGNVLDLNKQKQYINNGKKACISCWKSNK